MQFTHLTIQSGEEFKLHYITTNMPEGRLIGNSNAVSAWDIVCPFSQITTMSCLDKQSPLHEAIVARAVVLRVFEVTQGNSSIK